MSRLGPRVWCTAVFTAGVSLLGLGLVSFSPSRSVAQQPGFSQAEIHDPSSPRYVPLTPIDGTNQFIGGTNGNHHAHSHSSFVTPGLIPPGVFFYNRPFGYWGPVSGPYLGGFVPGGYSQGVWLQWDPFYGAQAAPPLIGLGNGRVADPQQMPRAKPAQPAADGFGILAPDAAVAKKVAKPRATNADARARSQRFIVLGDGYFAKQAYSDANSRYKLAQQSAPDMGDGFLRQGFALVAMGRYETAARSLKRGIALSPDWAQSPFRLDQLYGANGLAKAAHVEALAQEALKAPSSDAMFLLGVMLYFDGQKERAEPFLVRARELAGGDDAHLDGFLHEVAPPADEAPAPAAPVTEARKAAVVPIANHVAPFSKLPSTSGATRVPKPLPPATAPRRTAPASGAADEPARDL
jgi:hypothetical protein